MKKPILLACMAILVADTASARFVSADPFEGRQTDPRTLNRYTYAHNDPIHKVDPDGLEATTLGQMNSLNVMGVLSGVALPLAAGLAAVSTGTRIKNIVTSRPAADACAKSYAAGLQAFRSGDCYGVRMPIVFMSEAQLPGIGQHVFMSQGMGSPAILHRTQLLTYTNRLVALAKCALNKNLPVAVGGNSCDEYPFASTYEGGMGSTVAKVPLSSNLRQGGVLGSFYGVCGVAADAFPLNEFLVLPVASSGTSFECRW